MNLSLADLAADPSKIDHLDGPSCGDAIIQASALVARLGARLATSRVIVDAGPVVETTNVFGAAAIIGVAPSTIKKKIMARERAYVALLVPTGTRRLVFSVARCRMFAQRSVIGGPGA